MPEQPAVNQPAVLQAEIMEAIAAALGDDAPAVGVAVKDRCAMLSGEVPGMLAGEAAVNAALSVPGVLAVHDGLVVHPDLSYPPLSQVDVARAVADAIAWAADEPDSVRAEVAEGRVRLTGSVRWDIEREAVGKAVRRVHGVIGVDNRVEVVAPETAEAR